MKKLFLVIVVLSLLWLPSQLVLQGDCATSGISREDLQLFLKQPGNAVENPRWFLNYQNKPVRWQGQVYAVYIRGEGSPVEVLIKVLPDSRLYDTVLTLPANHPMVPGLKKGQLLTFKGVLTHVVDTFLVKEVHVQYRDEEEPSREEPQETDPDIDRKQLSSQEGVLLYRPKYFSKLLN